MSDNPNVDNTSNIQMQPMGMPASGQKQQAEYVEGTLPIYMLKSLPGAGYEPTPPGTDLDPPPPPPPDEIANIDDPTSQSPGAPTAPSAPVNVDVPVVSQLEGVLSCTMGNWTGEPTAYAYVWKLDGVTIGSNAADYTITVDDIGKTATCDVTASNAAGATAAPTSNALVVADPTGP